MGGTLCGDQEGESYYKVERGLCKLLASFASHFMLMTPKVKYSSLVMKMNGAEWS